MPVRVGRTAGRVVGRSSGARARGSNLFDATATRRGRRPSSGLFDAPVRQPRISNPVTASGRTPTLPSFPAAGPVGQTGRGAANEVAASPRKMGFGRKLAIGAAGVGGATYLARGKTSGAAAPNTSSLYGAF